MTAATLLDDLWLSVLDGDLRARWLYRRHYSYRPYRDRRDPKLFVGPGEKLVLMTADCAALFAWRKFISDDHQEGVCCAVFRNESPFLSSELILDAEQIAWEKWPGERFYTYINPKKIKSVNPGYCFKKAGWTQCEKKLSGLIVLEKRPCTV